MAKQVEAAVEKIVTGLLADSGLELVDVEYVKERDWYLRVFIDKPEGIGIEDCQQLSEKLKKQSTKQEENRKKLKKQCRKHLQKLRQPVCRISL